MDDAACDHVSGFPTPRRFQTNALDIGRGGPWRHEGSSRGVGGVCEAYWYPIYAFVRHKGHKADEASTWFRASSSGCSRG